MLKSLKMTLVISLSLLISGAVYAQQASKSWTFMVYMDGDNNLEQPLIEDFTEMAKVARFPL